MIVYQAYGPDNIPIDRDPFPTREAAQAAIDKFPERFKQQGYYSGVGYRLALDQITASCRIAEEEWDEEDEA